MRTIDLPIKGGIVGHGATAPVGVKGLVWAVNTFPFRDWGHILWRPRCLMGTENSDYATIFDPSTYDYIDSCCAQDGMMVLIGNTTESKLVWWKPGSAPVTFSWSFPACEHGYGQVTMAGKDVAVAIEGDGIWIVEYDQTAETFNDRYKIGAGLVGYAGGGTGQTIGSSPTTTIASISGSDPAYVFTATIFCMASDGSDFTFSMAIDGVQALETYNSDYMTQQAGGALIWTPMTFTFNRAFTPPFDVQVSFLGSGDLYIESASRYVVNHDWSVAWASNALHMNIGGTLCPDGGVVGTNRGAVIGKYNGNFIQMADIGQWAFQDEIVVDDEVMGIKSTGPLMIVATKGAIFAVSGWSYQGVNIQKLYDYGIRKPREMFSIAGGVVAYVVGKPLLISGQGVIPSAFPFLFEIDADTYVTYLPRHNMTLIAIDGYEKVCVWDAEAKAAVWWRFDEVSKAIPMGCCKDILLFDSGKAYYLGFSDDSSWPGYDIELAVSTGELGPSPYFAIHKVAFDGPILNHSDSAVATLEIASVSPYNIHVASVDIDQPALPDFSSLPPWLSLDTDGVYGPVPEDGKGYLLLFPNYHGAIDTSVVSETEYDSGLLPTGNSFILGLTLNDKVIKHPGALLKSIKLYIEEVGAALQ